MLVLSRRVGERIVIGQDITVTVCRVSGGKVSLGIEAPSDVLILREEVLPDAAVDLAETILENELQMNRRIVHSVA